MTSETPPLEAGFVRADQPDVGALHRLVLGQDAAETLWVDAGGAATTYGLTDAAGRGSGAAALRGIRVARAFTAHQHHQLVRDAVAAASGRTDLVVAPNVAALYDAADAPAAEIDRLYTGTLDLLAGLADALDAPVLVTAPRADGERLAAVAARAEGEVTCRRTELGYAYETADFETTAYWAAGWWQTTIPYWVELCGSAAEARHAGAVRPRVEGWA